MPSEWRTTNRAYAAALGGLAFAFFLRVLGQALVAVAQVNFLPPMEEWFSGLIPYRALLPIQILVLVVQAMICRDVWNGRGFFARRRPAVGDGLRWFSCVYFAAMVLRYVVTMMISPGRRWFSGTIPIIFHWVLAAYLFVLGRYYSIQTDAKAAG